MAGPSQPNFHSLPVDGCLTASTGRSGVNRTLRVYGCLKKGARVFVAGKLNQRSWEDKDGGKRQASRSRVTNVGPDLQFATATIEKAKAEQKAS